MSVPSRSTLTMCRALLPGRRFHVDAQLCHEGMDPMEYAFGKSRDVGPEHFLAVLANGRRPDSLHDDQFDREVEQERRRGNCERRLDRQLSAALQTSGLPDRIGVFVPDCSRSIWSASELPLDVSLGVVARRSGSLYLPHRPVHSALVLPARETWVLFFPDEVPLHEC
jgi:hypothetical protein